MQYNSIIARASKVELKSVACVGVAGDDGGSMHV
jgi:hypothetical protein